MQKTKSNTKDHEHSYNIMGIFMPLKIILFSQTHIFMVVPKFRKCFLLHL